MSLRAPHPHVPRRGIDAILPPTYPRRMTRRPANGDACLAMRHGPSHAGAPPSGIYASG
jgi:hypothetical protein